MLHFILKTVFKCYIASNCLHNEAGCLYYRHLVVLYKKYFRFRLGKKISIFVVIRNDSDRPYLHQ